MQMDKSDRQFIISVAATAGFTFIALGWPGMTRDIAMVGIAVSAAVAIYFGWPWIRLVIRPRHSNGMRNMGPLILMAIGFAAFAMAAAWHFRPHDQSGLPSSSNTPKSSGNDSAPILLPRSGFDVTVPPDSQSHIRVENNSSCGLVGPGTDFTVKGGAGTVDVLNNSVSGQCSDTTPHDDAKGPQSPPQQPQSQPKQPKRKSRKTSPS